MYRLRSTLATLAFATFASPFIASAQSPDIPNQPPSDQQLAALHCVIGEEKTLPGDYYYCLGSLAYGEHQYAQAQTFFKTAASWASKPAQYVLGVMALGGDHQPRDIPLALAWLSLASERPRSRYALSYQQLDQQATPTQREQAKSLIQSMQATYADAVAAPRAENRYRQGMADLARIDRIGGSSYCMEGMVDPTKVGADQINPSACPQTQQVADAVDAAAVNVFDGWSGHVTVGPLLPAGQLRGKAN